MANIYSYPDPIYQPAMRVITAITKSNPATVTTSIDHDYITGEIVRLVIPLANKMWQANGRTGTITVTGGATFTIDVDTTFFDSFVVPAVNEAQVIPVGEINAMLRGATKNVLPSGNR